MSHRLFPTLPVGLALLGLSLLSLSLGCAPSNTRQTIRIDGSSTVFPVSEAVAEEFSKANPNVNVTVGQSGTGGGMKRFANGEIEIADASRPMKESERKLCEEAGIEFIELSVAFDGIAIVVSKENDWCETLTLEQLKHMWRPEDPAMKWSDINPEWPEEDLSLHGPGTNSGTFDYFTEEIVGEVQASRADYSPNEDDNVIVTGVAGDKHALGYFGFAYYVENADKLTLLGVDAGEGPVKPSMDTIMANTYAPLSRPLFIYVRTDALAQPAVAKFVEFYMEKAAELSSEVGYVPVPADVAEASQQRLADAMAAAAK